MSPIQAGKATLSILGDVLLHAASQKSHIPSNSTGAAWSTVRVPLPYPTKEEPR